MGFERTGGRSEFSEPGFNAIEMPDWSIFIADGTDHFLEVSEEQAAAPSKSGRSLFFTCSDTVMCTQLVEYENGTELWRIDYNGMEGISDAEIAGAAPSIVHEMLAESRREQAEDDEADYIYDTTAKVGRAMTGFRHDADPEVPGDPEPIQVLRPVA